MQRVSPFLLSACDLAFPPVSATSRRLSGNNGANEKHFKCNTHECMHGRALMSLDELLAGGMMGGRGMEVNGTSGRMGSAGGCSGRDMFAPL